MDLEEYKEKTHRKLDEARNIEDFEKRYDAFVMALCSFLCHQNHDDLVMKAFTMIDRSANRSE